MIMLNLDMSLYSFTQSALLEKLNALAAQQA
jgi:hypothetical protein